MNRIVVAAGAVGVFGGLVAAAPQSRRTPRPTRRSPFLRVVLSESLASGSGRALWRIGRSGLCCSDEAVYAMTQ